MSDELFATIITAGAGLVGTVIAWFLSKGKTKTDFAIQLRNELREDIKRWKEAAEVFERKANQLYKEIDEWRDKYDQLEEKCDQISRDNRNLTQENQRLSKEVTDLQQQITNLK